MLDMPDFAAGQIQGMGDVRGVTYGSDTGLFVEFRYENVHQEFQSDQVGHAVYKQVPFVRIHTPGDKTKVVDRPVRMEGWGDAPPDHIRWPQQWAAFQQGQRAIQDGTPLSEWPKITANQVREFNAFNIYTVEQLSAVSDSSLDGLGHGGRALRDAARAWLERAKDDSALTKMEARHEAEMAEMRAQMANMQSLLEQATAPDETKRGPGRPKKEVTDGE